MGIRDIRSQDDWEDREEIHGDQAWRENIELTDAEQRSTVMPAAIPLTTDDGQRIVGRDGHAAAMQTVLTQTPDAVKLAWAKKQARDPCWMCEHFKFRMITRDEKLLLLQKLLVQEHGWTEDGVRGDLGSVDNFEWCRVYELLTHKNASCPRLFKLRSDLPARKI